MSTLKKLLSALLCLIFLSFFSSAIPNFVYASQEFHTSYIVNYRFDDSGRSRVEQQISLTNKLSRVYATRYELTLEGETPSQISGKDRLGPLKTTSSKSGENTNITVQFNDPVVGKGKTLAFTLNYLGRPATKNGQVWEIVLPKLGTPDLIDDYQLNLYIPDSWGKPAYISPPPVTTEDNKFTFNKNQVLQTGIVAAFGDFQSYSFTLKYHLENASPDPVSTQIALPPDTSYQRVFYDSIDPSPRTIEVDPDGNWMATYDLSPKQKVDIVATGQAHILAEPTAPLLESVPQRLNDYLTPTKYWPADDAKIRSLAALTTPRQIYDYVVDTLDYDYGRVQPGAARLGALGALASPRSALCTEFTDLFITLARAAGIPAREINGFAYTTDPKLKPLSLVADVLHSWPEYWDKSRNTWIAIDPTWGDTTGGINYFDKLDFNHFAFAIHGLRDSSPLAAGLYKLDSTAGDVRVTLSPYREYPVQPLEIDWRPPFQLFPFLKNISRLTISNPQGQALYRVPISLDPQNISASPGSSVIPVLLPFSSRKLDISLSPRSFFSFAPKSLGVYVAGQSIAYNIPNKLFLAFQISVALISSFFIVFLVWIAEFAWGIYLQRRRRADSLRG